MAETKSERKSVRLDLYYFVGFYFVVEREWNESGSINFR